MRRLPLRATCATLLSAFLFLAAPVHATIALDAPVPVGPQVTVGTLPNGLRYYIQKNTRPEKKVELRLVVKAGSILEDEDQQGLAHVTEHMAFNGSTHFKKHELVSYLQSIGVQYGADLNAYTSFDETVYRLHVPTDKPEHIEQAMLVLEDWAHGLTLADADIDKERDIVLEELRRGKGAHDRMNKVLFPKLFNGSRYADRLPIGKETILKSFKPDAVKRFYRDWYRPDLMAVVIVGDVDPAQADKLIHQHFDRLTNPKPARARTETAIPIRAETEAVVVTDAEATNDSVAIRYPVRQIKERLTLGEYRHKMVESLFAAMLGARMQELTQQATPPFVGGGSGVGKLARSYQSYMSTAVLGRNGALPAITALVQENERARQFGFSAAELERAKKNMMHGFERAYNERDKTDSAAYADEYIRHFLDHEPIPGLEAENRYMHELMPTITLDELNRYARETIPSKSAKLVMYTGSNKANTSIPTGPELLAAVAAAEQAPVSAHVDRKVAARLMDKLPTPGAIVGERSDKTLGTTTLTLSNGITVVLRPSSFKNDQVLMSAVRWGGQSLFDTKDAYNAQFAAAIAASMGVQDFSPLQLRDLLAGKSVSTSAFMTLYSEGVGGSASAGDLETMLQLMHLRFGNVRRDEALYQSFIGKQRDLAKNALSHPESVLQDTLASTLYHDHPRAPRVLRPEFLDQVSLERASAIFGQRFASARGMTFIFVGSFDLAAIKPLLATYVASLPTPPIATAYRDIGLSPVTGVIKKEVFKGSEAKSTVSLTYSGSASYNERERMLLGALIDITNIRITDILREKLTLIYSGNMHGSISKVPTPHYTINTSLPCGPDNVDKVIAAMQDEIATLRRDGPSAADWDKVRQKWLQSHRKALQENGYWLSQLQSAQMNETDPALILSYEQRVGAITVDQLKAAAQRYFDPANMVQLVLKPEPSIQQAAAQ